MHHNEEAMASDRATGKLGKQVAMIRLAKHLVSLFHRGSEDEEWERMGVHVRHIFNLSEDDLGDLSDEMSDVLSHL